MSLVVLDLIVVLMIGAITYALSSEGAWGAALMFFNVLLASMVALNFYEPLATLLVEYMPSMLVDFSDMIVFMALFGLTIVILKLITDNIAPSMVKLPSIVYNLGRFGFGLAAALVTVGTLLLALHLAPVHKKILGVMAFDSRPPFKFGLDVEMLAFFQRATGGTFALYGNDRNDPFQTYKDAHVFDPQGRWLIDRQLGRGFGEGDPLGDEQAAAPAAEGSAPATPGPTN